MLIYQVKKPQIFLFILNKKPKRKFPLWFLYDYEIMIGVNELIASTPAEDLTTVQT